MTDNARTELDLLVQGITDENRHREYPLLARPASNLDYASIRERVIKRFEKTLSYLAKH